MSGNTFGKIFKITTFGESHGNALGVVVDGCPAGLKIDIKKIQSDLDKRRPGQTSKDGKANAAVTNRKEADQVEILSGVFNDITEGTPIAMVIKNTSQHSNDYSNLATSFRPGHADFSFYEKYGFRDYRGGGRSSGRETAARVAAGAIAKMLIDQLCPECSITAYTLRAAGVQAKKIDFNEIEKNAMRSPDSESATLMMAKIEQLQKEGNSTGGIIECQVKGISSGLGEPVFDKLDAVIAQAMLSIGAVKGIEFGSGFSGVDSTGKENNDVMKCNNGKKNCVEFLSNNAGGIIGGISNGNDIIFRIAIKPVASIFTEQETIKIADSAMAEGADCETSGNAPGAGGGNARANGNVQGPDGGNTNCENRYQDTRLQIAGRHDVCLCPRIVPVVEAMTAITIADMILQNRSSRI